MFGLAFPMILGSVMLLQMCLLLLFHMIINIGVEFHLRLLGQRVHAEGVLKNDFKTVWASEQWIMDSVETPQKKSARLSGMCGSSLMRSLAAGMVPA